MFYQEVDTTISTAQLFARKFHQNPESKVGSYERHPEYKVGIQRVR
jgi:hypothetical protein